MPEKFEIVEKKPLTPDITSISVYAPLIARKARAGQFIILRATDGGERIPLTVSSVSGELVTVVYQKVGDSTMTLDELHAGERLADFVGPLGEPTPIDGVKRAAVIGGGLGCAIALPVAKALHDAGAYVELIGGFRTRDLVILEDEMRGACDELTVCTDDGSYGFAGFTTGKLEERLKAGARYDRVYAIGPLVMMKFVCRLTREFDTPTIVSMNPIMIDGTGMCGCCRVTVDGQVKFACVDGPDFDGHKIDFDETIARAATYKEFEQRRRAEHKCRLEGMNNG